MNAAGARAAVTAATSQRDVARLQRDRIAALRGRSLVSEAQLDQANDALKAAEAALQQARQQLGVRENQVRYATLTAEHDGIITTQDAEAGQVVAAGQRVFGLAWSDEREVHIAVPESRVGTLRDAASLDASSGGSSCTAPAASRPTLSSRRNGCWLVRYRLASSASRSGLSGSRPARNGPAAREGHSARVGRMESDIGVGVACER
jgi:multidrug efflux pump subunit AcrA (membrane-fusion protein)